MGPFCSQLHCSSSVLQGETPFLLFCMSLATRYCRSVDLAAMEPKDWMLWAMSPNHSSIFSMVLLQVFVVVMRSWIAQWFTQSIWGCLWWFLTFIFQRRMTHLTGILHNTLIFRDFIFFSCILNCWYPDYNTNSQFNITFPEWTTLDASTQPVLTSFICNALHIKVDSSL